jgi:hemoglobin-like flavoprotein
MSKPQKKSTLTPSQIQNGSDAIEAYIGSFYNEICRDATQMDIEKNGTKYLTSVLSDFQFMIRDNNSRDDALTRLNDKYDTAIFSKFSDKFMSIFDLAHKSYDDGNIFFKQIHRLSNAQNQQISDEEYNDEIKGFISTYAKKYVNQNIKENHYQFVLKHKENTSLKTENLQLKEQLLQLEEQLENLKSRETSQQEVEKKEPSTEPCEPSNSGGILQEHVKISVSM